MSMDGGLRPAVFFFDGTPNHGRETVIDKNTAMRAGTAALESGDALTARRHFESVLAAGQGDAQTCILLALACQKLNDVPALHQAIDRALALDPRNLHALLMKGDRLLATGNARAAAQFYGAAVALASQARNLPPVLVEYVRRAAETRDRIQAHIEEHLRKQLAAAGYDERSSSARFAQSIDMLTGRKQLYTQAPRAYYFPELPQIAFFPRESFPWLDAIEAATDDICAELQGVLARNRGLEPYIQASGDVPLGDRHGLLNSLEWSAFFLYKNGELIAENAAQCPKTLAALEQVPFPRIKGRDPMVLFSVLKPGVRIAPHHGFLNTRLICHLPLIVPPGCYLRVGNDQREFQKGKAWVFDDSIEHEAWNSSNEPRVILIFDIWRPELSEQERQLIAALLEAVDSYSSPRVEWTD
jgi:aspartyl/asparaginyl beta-hydroxylase (cupin superfamily)